ncbi:7,8-didemethyl-8-hydroxy-5-deazariboflavin synthase subunit CofG [Halanaerobacter jeridensis]|uniref:7,8-didemethyl-8-hydroxy-5-deazariboflavin synthase n=1 Tax=Halanaerobacter jeridensis TaxID=706427 RepID=A0A939BQY2_9FIRM|nr:7,8-didemethyl-8-hydroxy-5-deazariboflavin synthase subunit CofG [Halanaerobacter jeridensis]MBM7555411.1 FO synthase subunit 1 [Halanaerobacter jeridensis]
MKTVTYSKNVFIPLTTVCANNCTYCHFKEAVSEAKIMSMDEIQDILQKAKEAGCKEVLFTCGTKPEQVSDFKKKLQQKTGFDSWISFVIAACQEALKQGLLPHSNIGVVEKDELKELANYNASLGLMLETTADLKAHTHSPTKTFEVRRDFIAAAGELKIPFTSGLLLGIGESRQDRIASLEELKKLFQQYGHLQEVILQPVDPPSNSHLFTPKVEVLIDTLQLANEILAEDIAVQVPPNLVDLEEIPVELIDDLGGVSTLTPDYINPDHQWPKIKELKNLFPEVEFQERLPIYSQYLNQKWIRKSVWDCLQSEGWLDEYRAKRDFSKS